MHIVQKHVSAESDVLQKQGLDGDVYHDIKDNREAIEKNLRGVLEQMKESLEQAHGSGKVDRVRWMCHRLRTAMRDTKLLTNDERTKCLLRINELCMGYGDVSEADRVALDLLQSDCSSALSESKSTDLFVGSIQNTLERGSGSIQKLEDILPSSHRLAQLMNPKFFKLLEQEAASGKTPEKDFIGQTILHIAAANGQVALVKYILDLGLVNIEKRDDAGRTAVYLAISHGQCSTYRYLRDRNASLRIRSRAGHSPLAMATQGNHVSIMEDLITNARCSVNEKALPAMGGDPLLHIAAGSGHLGAVQVLLRHGANRGLRRMADDKTAAELARTNGHSNLADIIDTGG